MSEQGCAPLLEVSDLRVVFPQRRRREVRAVDGVTLQVGAAETVGLVGESGSGKSTLGRAILGLTEVTGGSIAFRGADITHAGRAERRTLSASLQVVFQDPYSSLNPTKTVGQTLSDPLRVHRSLSRAETRSQVEAMLERVGLPVEAADRYPLSFSGGQRQRIAIARALMVSPQLVVCDEPVSALDLSIQAQVVNLLGELQRELSVSYLFIAHDLEIVRYVARRTVVLYRGRVLEAGPADAVYRDPKHPYTQALIQAVPVPDPLEQRSRRARRRAAGAADGRDAPVDGCPFAPRCPHVFDRCWVERPAELPVGDGHVAACHLYSAGRAPGESGAVETTASAANR